MAAIVELSYPSNVTLIEGAMQNWRDLPVRGPAASDAVAHLLDDLDLSGHVVVVGPHPESLVMRIAKSAGRLSVITRAIPDAADLGTAVPTATVLCGALTAAVERLEPADVVIALADAALLLSAEEETLEWIAFPLLLQQISAPGAQILMAVENERGMQIGAGWNPHWHQPTDLFANYTDDDFMLGLNAAQTTLAGVAQLAGAKVPK